LRLAEPLNIALHNPLDLFFNRFPLRPLRLCGESRFSKRLIQIGVAAMQRAGNGLRTYNAKRNFGVTPEPRGARAAKNAVLQFVVQKHHARNLHYDFRLELDGALKSWAVPKGPSLDPADKRLAVHVEDHPVEYGNFEGIIPANQYGAGEVILWDRGSWVPHGEPRRDYKAGKLKFELKGKKLRGNWTLVRTRLKGSGDKEQWLLIKEKDAQARAHDGYDITVAEPGSVNRGPAGTRKQSAEKAQPGAKPASARSKARVNEASRLANARKSALPPRLAPQLATLVGTAPEGEWSYELKFDGYRLLARLAKGKARLFTRNGHDWTRKLAAQAKALEQLGLADAWLDGEIVVPGKDGVPDFQALQNAFDEQRTGDVHYFLFDLPWYAGYDLRASPLAQRRGLLKPLLPGKASALLHFSEDIADSPQDILASACRMGMEGVIGKRRDSPYASGRSKSWIKLKCENRQEFVIGGFTDPQRSRTGLGALLLGFHEKGKLRYAGRTGTGFDDKQLAQLSKRLGAIEIRKAPFENPPSGADARGVHWVKPQLVAEVSFAQWTKERIVRQAVFHGLRTDKAASSIGYEKPAATPRKSRSAKASISDSGAPVRKPSGGSARQQRVLVGNISISHPDRVIDPDSGLTKLDVARYYEKIAPALLPHLENRPVSLVRLPDGLKGEQFFQKHMGKGQIPEARLLDRKLDPGHPPLIAIETPAALAGAAQMGVVELHTWNAIAGSIERPDRIIFDLDPDPALSWARVLEAAELTRNLLDALGVKSFVKTSGGRGVHIVVPLRRLHEWNVAKDFSRAVAEHLAATIPARFSAKMGAANRIGKVFVDYLRNNRGSTTVSAFSLRARPGLPVSVPVTWKELATTRQSDYWNIGNIHERLAGLKKDPWGEYEESRQSLRKAIALLEKSRAEGRGTRAE
jgi:bifunctional non-homologous end joining protein LigD